MVRLWALAAREVHGAWPRARFVSAPEFVAAYGWLRGGLATSLDELLHRPADELMQSLETAAGEGWIPPLDSKSRTRMKRMLSTRRGEAAAWPAPSGEPARMADALRMIPDADRLQLNAPNGLGRQVLVRLLAPVPDEGSRLDTIRGVLGTTSSPIPSRGRCGSGS